MRRCGFVVVLATLLATPSLVVAEESPPDASAEAELGHTILLYGKVGGLIPVSKLGPHASVRLGLGYVPPLLAGRLGLIADVGYSATETDGTLADPRLGAKGADYRYALTQHDINLFVGPQGFILDPREGFVPYAAVGVDIHFLRSDIDGVSAEQAFGENQETSTKIGFAVRAGCGYRLGPGMVTAEASFAWAPIDHDVTGESHLGRIAILLGYTAML